MPSSTYKSLAEVVDARGLSMSDKWQHYLPTYDKELESFVRRGQPLSLLQIGAGNGEWLPVWGDYLPSGSRVVGLDSEASMQTVAFGDDISVHFADISNKEAIRAALGSAKFDIVVDARSHPRDKLENPLADIVDLMLPGGVYFIEDLQTSYKPYANALGVRSSDADHLKLFAGSSKAPSCAERSRPSIDDADLQSEVERLTQRSALLEFEVTYLRQTLHAVQLSPFWRLTGPLRRLIEALPTSTKIWLRRGAKAGWWAATPWQMPQRISFLRNRSRLSPAQPGVAMAPTNVGATFNLKRPESAYSRWVAAYDTLNNEDRRAIKARIARLRYKPTISIVMPVYNSDLDHLREAIRSVTSQIYPFWELCIADDASAKAGVRELLAEVSASEPRIKVVHRESNGHISAASNSALNIATGEFVGLMDHDDIIPEHALFVVAAYLNEDQKFDLIYSDEDHLDERGKRTSPYFKSDFNYELLLGHNMVNHFSVFRRAVVNAVGGFRLGYEGSQDYDLVLRVIDAIDHSRILHIPSILYHWRSTANADTFSQSYAAQCLNSARRAIADHLARREQDAKVLPHPVVSSWHRVQRARPNPNPLVSIIIPTKDKADILRPCCEGILNRTDYTNIELIIVDHQSEKQETADLLSELSRDERVRVLPYKGEFNYAAINNAAVDTARGALLALINNDVEVIGSDWLDEMVTLAVRDDVGAVGAKLLYANNRVQHGGVLIGTGGVAGHLSHMLEPNDPGDMGRAVLTTAVSAVTGACLVIKTSVFKAVGGFDEKNLPIAFNDVDLCLKVREAGYRNVLAAQAILYHHESVSRGLDTSPEKAARFRKEAIFMMEKWGEQLTCDPYYNLNLDLATAKHEPAFPPRTKRLWTPQSKA